MRANLVLGLPASGKSTYIAALGHILLKQDVETEFRLELGEDESHILSLQESWLKYEVLQHTPTGAENWVKFHLVSNATEEALILELPDFSGESLKNSVATGIYTTELASALAGSEGIFLFTNAAGRQDDVLLNDLYGMLPEIVDVSDQATNSASIHEIAGPASNDKQKEVTFDPTAMPEEPKLVQLLQTTSELLEKKRKLVVMVSAWDVVQSGDAEIQPADWLRANKPMLWQYLNHNAKFWEARVYGVSAQGGRIPQDTEILKKVPRASQRVKMIGHSAKLHDLTAPLAWLAEG